MRELARRDGATRPSLRATEQTSPPAPVSIASDVLKEHVHTDANINRFIMTVGVALAFEGECSRRRWRVGANCLDGSGRWAPSPTIADSDA